MDKIQKIIIFFLVLLWLYTFFGDIFLLPPYAKTPHNPSDSYSVDMLVREHDGESIERPMTHIAKDLQDNIYIGFEPTAVYDWQYQKGLILVYGDDQKNYTLEFKAGRPFSFCIDNNLLHLQLADSPTLTRVYTLQGEYIESYPVKEKFNNQKKVTIDNGITYQIGGIYSLTLTKIISSTVEETIYAPSYLTLVLMSLPYAFACCTLLFIIFYALKHLRTLSTKR